MSLFRLREVWLEMLRMSYYSYIAIGDGTYQKGHKEHGEDIEQTATREVEEECGLKDLVLKEKLGITYHTYYLNGRYEIKETHWYEMTTESLKLTPQREEGIEKAVWIGEDKIDEVIENCYLSLQDLLKSIKLF